MSRRPILGLMLTILLVPMLATRAAAATQQRGTQAANLDKQELLIFQGMQANSSSPPAITQSLCVRRIARIKRTKSVRTVLSETTRQKDYLFGSIYFDAI